MPADDPYRRLEGLVFSGHRAGGIPQAFQQIGEMVVDDLRQIEFDGRRFGHVIDPRTGIPAPAWGSVTVVHPDPMVADILSTALFVMGPREGAHWADEHGFAALFLIARGDSVETLTTSPVRPLLVSQPPVFKGF